MGNSAQRRGTTDESEKRERWVSGVVGMFGRGGHQPRAPGRALSPRPFHIPTLPSPSHHMPLQIPAPSPSSNAPSPVPRILNPAGGGL